jgi:hypothetical protein
MSLLFDDPQANIIPQIDTNKKLLNLIAILIIFLLLIIYFDSHLPAPAFTPFRRAGL